MVADLITMRTAYVRRVWLVVGTEQNPSDTEWREFMSSVERTNAQLRGCIVYSLGGAPSAKQRKLLREVAKGNQQRTAVVTRSSVAVRVMTSLTWFLGDSVRVFDPSDFDRALQHVLCEDASALRSEIVRTLDKLAHELGVDLQRSTPPKAAGH